MQTNLMRYRVRGEIGPSSAHARGRQVRKRGVSSREKEGAPHLFGSVRLGFRLDRVELIVINAIGIASALNSLHTVLCLKTETRLRELAMMAGGSQEAVF